MSKRGIKTAAVMAEDLAKKQQLKAKETAAAAAAAQAAQARAPRAPAPAQAAADSEAASGADDDDDLGSEFSEEEDFDNGRGEAGVSDEDDLSPAIAGAGGPRKKAKGTDRQRGKFSHGLLQQATRDLGAASESEGDEEEGSAADGPGDAEDDALGGVGAGSKRSAAAAAAGRAGSGSLALVGGARPRKGTKIAGSTTALSFATAFITKKMQDDQANLELNYMQLSADDFAHGYMLKNGGNIADARRVLLEFNTDHPNAIKAALGRVRQHLRTNENAAILTHLKNDLPTRVGSWAEMSPVELSQAAFELCLDSSNPFLDCLWRAIPDYFFPSKDALPPLLRLVYVAGAAVALAPRINEPAESKRRFAAGFSRDNMPRGLGDAAPTHVIEAVRAADGDAGGAAIVKWRDFLKRMTLVSEAYLLTQKARSGGPLRATPSKAVVASAAVSTAMKPRVLAIEDGSPREVASSAADERPNLNDFGSAQVKSAKWLFELASKLWDEVYEGATPLSEAASLMEQERRFIRDQKNGTRVLIDAAALGKAASPLISLIFNDANEAAYTAARLSSAGADAKAVEAFE